MAAYPDGGEGIDASINAMLQKLRDGRLDPDVKGWAHDVLKAAGIDGRTNYGTVRTKTQALLDALRASTIYSPDPHGAEWIQSASATLCLRPGLCMRGGDCFPEGTLVKQRDLRSEKYYGGSVSEVVTVESVAIGDLIWGLNAWSRVEAKWSKGLLSVDAIELSNSHTMRLTGDHHVFRVRESVERVRVRDLVVGDVLLQPDPHFLRNVPQVAVISLTRDVATVPCWDIETSDHYVFLPDFNVTVSQCDDLSVALGSATLSLGIPTAVVKQDFGVGQQQHVLIAVEDEQGNWLPADPSTTMPVGQSATAKSETYYNPMDQNSHATGTSGADIVTLGFVGAVTSAFSQAQSDLDSQVTENISEGDTFLASSNYESAIASYQKAGQAGATVVGPEIDLAGAPAVTQPLTHQAWVTNGDLAAIPGASAATLENADLAQTYAKNNAALYQQAINDGSAAVTLPNAGAKPASGPGQAVLWVLGLGTLAGVVIAMKRPSKKRRR